MPIRLEGYALHAGVAAAVTLERQVGPLTFARDSHRAALEDLRAVRTDCGVQVTDGRGLELDLVEHLLAAFAGLGLRQGVLVTVEGPELPILDGGALVFAEALARLEIQSEAPRLAVARAGELVCGASRYTFEPGDGVDVEVETIFDAPLGTQRARWTGEPARFLAEIAPARTFGFATQASALWSRGRGLLASSASQADANAARALSSAVLVFDKTGSVLRGTPPPGVNEVAHHKLLDLIGDFALYGGPPRGRIFATRPGHTASHQIVREALSLGLLSRR